MATLEFYIRYDTRISTYKIFNTVSWYYPSEYYSLGEPILDYTDNYLTLTFDNFPTNTQKYSLDIESSTYFEVEKALGWSTYPVIS
jgi:hypothetical protein